MGIKKYTIAGPIPESAVEQTTIKDLLKEARLVNFNDEPLSDGAIQKPWGAFETKHIVRLCKTRANQVASQNTEAQGEVLHYLAEFGMDGLDSFVIWVTKYHPSLLECTNNAEGGESPLHTAIRVNNHPFAKLLLDHADPVVLLRQVTGFNYTCLHAAIEYRSPLTEYIIEKAQNLYRTNAADSNGSTEKSNSVTKTTEDINIFTTCVVKNESDENMMTPLHFAAVTPIKADKHSVRTNIPQPNGRTGLSWPIHALKLKEEEKLVNSSEVIAEFDLLKVVKKLIQVHPRVLIDYKDSDDETPFQSRLTYLEFIRNNENNADEQNEDKRVPTADERRLGIIRNDLILSYMREYIIDKFDRKDAMKALYRVGEGIKCPFISMNSALTGRLERVIYFDLSDFPHPTINMEFFNGLGKVLRFEGLLKYVFLPRLVVEDDERFGSTHRTTVTTSNANLNQRSQAIVRGSHDMSSIFQWLKDHNVESVLKVIVVDDVEPCHSDEVIESCMRNLNTRVWNWSKIDLCCDVINDSAPLVEDVTLYSSGNNAVLVGWSSSAGLAKLKNLKAVHICFQKLTISKGLENPMRLEKYIRTFEEELKKLMPSVTFTRNLPKPSYMSAFPGRNLERTMSGISTIFISSGGHFPADTFFCSESSWMRTMTNFGAFLKRAKTTNPVKPVKIAIIDDGIDMRLEIFNNKVQVGESFYSLGKFSGRHGAYFVPSGSHGTLMAQLICEICPVVKLYIAQLEVFPGKSGKRSFNALSATDAIIWAANQGVDIISMSWSIEDKSESRFFDPDLQKMQKALQDAINKNIILFCSSIDEGTNATDTTYPGKVHGCIKIGASTVEGEKLSWASTKNSNFLAPGDGLQITSNSWDNSNIGSVGSSVSTALAAGLAGDLLYCERLIRADESTDNIDFQAEETKEEIDSLRELKKMERAFQYISKGTRGDKFLHVSEHLEFDPERMAWDSKSRPEETRLTKEKLKDLMKSLNG